MASILKTLTSRKGKRLVLGAILLAAWALRELPDRGQSADASDAGSSAVVRAFEEQRSDTWLVTRGTVERTLADDNKGSRHQRFILRVAPDLTVLVAHNIDLADKVPLRAGDTVELRGEYEWNAQGGVVHWTHHDPKGRKEGGWIRYGGKSYR